jgi:hypothetical protein
MYVGNVRTKEDAQRAIALLLEHFAGETAFGRLVNDSKCAKQTTDEMAYRTAGNLLASFVTRKPGGAVIF